MSRVDLSLDAVDAAHRINDFKAVHDRLPTVRGMAEIIDACRGPADVNLRARFMAAYKAVADRRDEWHRKYVVERNEVWRLEGLLKKMPEPIVRTFPRLYSFVLGYLSATFVTLLAIVFLFHLNHK